MSETRFAQDVTTALELVDDPHLFGEMVMRSVWVAARVAYNEGTLEWSGKTKGVRNAQEAFANTIENLTPMYVARSKKKKQGKRETDAKPLRNPDDPYSDDDREAA